MAEPITGQPDARIEQGIVHQNDILPFGLAVIFDRREKFGPEGQAAKVTLIDQR